jgi:hypothetical protein
VTLEEAAVRFMMLMIPGPGEDEAAAARSGREPHMLRYNESLQRAGVLLALDQLHPPSMGARVSFPGGRVRVLEGDSRGAHEVVSGYWMIQVKSPEEAIVWASRCPAGHRAIIEVRRVQDLRPGPH